MLKVHYIPALHARCHIIFLDLFLSLEGPKQDPEVEEKDLCRSSFKLEEIVVRKYNEMMLRPECMHLNEVV